MKPHQLTMATTISVPSEYAASFLLAGFGASRIPRPFGSLFADPVECLRSVIISIGVRLCEMAARHSEERQ
jgi:hypothetical protein